MDKYSMRDCLNCLDYAPHVYDMCGNCAVMKIGFFVQELEKMAGSEYIMEVLRNA